MYKCLFNEENNAERFLREQFIKGYKRPLGMAWVQDGADETAELAEMKDSAVSFMLNLPRLMPAKLH